MALILIQAFVTTFFHLSFFFQKQIYYFEETTSLPFTSFIMLGLGMKQGEKKIKIKNLKILPK
jgi:hypothetical protein